MLASQQMRAAGPEVDPLWLGSGRTLADLSKPQILIDSTYGDSHPGSRHLMRLAESARNAVYSSGAMPAIYTVTDICDGVATGHRGMDYSLVSRDLIAAMVEVHARAAAFDGVVAISSCDKAIPGHLMAIARLDIPAAHVPGGSMMPGPGFISADSCYMTDMRVAEGSMTEEEERYYQLSACPSCGACQYMGTASTMQAMSEALGIALPSSAMMPADTSFIARCAAETAESVCRLVRGGPRPSEIMTRAAFKNAIKIHAAIGGSTNVVLHIPAIAAELGIEITLDDIGRWSEGVPLLTSVLTAGKWPTQLFWFAGGVPRVMREISDMLDLDLPTITGRTVRENLAALERTGYFRRSAEFLGNWRMEPGEIIQTVKSPVAESSGIVILRGNIAPQGAVVKRSAVDPSMWKFVGRARVFDREADAVSAIYRDEIEPGTVIVIRRVGRHAAGSPEMLKATDAIMNKPALQGTTALVTDGRFSGASRGPCVGYLLPEAADGGPIALLRDGDIIDIDISARSISLAGPDDPAKTLADRAKDLTIDPPKLRGAMRFLVDG